MQTLSPALERVDDITVKEFPRSLLKIIGQYAGTDHCFTEGDYYYTKEPCQKIQLGQNGVPFFTRLLPVEIYNKYIINRCTPCSVDVTYVNTIYVAQTDEKRFKICHNKHCPRRKLMVCKRADFKYQCCIRNLIDVTEELDFENIWERTTTHVVFLLNEQQYQQAGLDMSWVHNFIVAGIALDIIDIGIMV